MAGTATPTGIRYEQTPEGATEVQLRAGGESVSRAFIVPLTIRIGAATVRMDGIGGVGTDEAHRNKGYSRRVLEAAVRRMNEGSAVLSTLYGIRDFYPKYGYATVGPEHVVHLTEPTRGAPLPDGWRVRPVAADDLPAVRRLYERTTDGAVGAVVRGEDAPAWSRLRETAGKGEADECRVVAGPSGEVEAYAWTGGDHWWMRFWRNDNPGCLLFAEVFADGPEAADAVLAACRAWAAEGEGAPREIRIAMPPEGPVAMAAMLHDARVTREYTRAGNFMGRTLGVSKLLSALAPELSLRLGASGIRSTGVLDIRTDEGGAALAFGPEGVRVADGPTPSGERLAVRLPQAELARLALGGFPPEPLLARLLAPPGERTEELLSTLFPHRHPHVYAVDRF